jgi:glycosyltransferase involved in cell wall biosynthesis
MKILQIAHSLGNGGAEKFVVELCNELAKTNEVTLCSVRPIEAWMLPPRKISSQVTMIELATVKKYSAVLFFKLFKLIRSTRPDVVHVHSSILVFYIFIISIFFRKTRFMQTIHNTITPGYAKLFDFLQRMRFVNRAFVNMCISKSIFDQYKSAYPNLNFVQIDNGIDKLSMTDKFATTKKEVEGLKKDKDSKVFTAIGNYSSFKNFSMLAEAFKELQHENINVILLMLGGGKSCDKINYEEVARIKDKNTHQLGLKDNVADYLGCSDALIMSSTKEGMPLVVLEALSVGLPVISTPAGGVVDIIENEANGIIARGFMKEDLLTAIKTFLKITEAQKQKIRENNLAKFVKNYSIKMCAGKYLESAYTKK